jgi:hypothetical protein
VEAAQDRVAPRQRRADARVDVFGKARVIGGGEGQVALEARPARSRIDRAASLRHSCICPFESSRMRVKASTSINLPSRPWMDNLLALHA